MNKQVIQQSAPTQRVIFRCSYKPCGHAQSFKCGCAPCGHAYAHEYYEHAGRLVRFVEDPLSHVVLTYTPEEDGERCPKCHKRFVKFGKVVGNVGKKACNDECLIATSGVCNCSCGGVNHAKALVQ